MSETAAVARPPTPQPDPAPRESAREGPTRMWSGADGSFSFADFLDIINPLQHIPVVSTIYRAITGDSIALGPQLIGGAVLGGPLGMIAAGAVAAVEEGSGRSVGATVVAAARTLFDPDAGEAPVQLASETDAAPPAPPPAAPLAVPPTEPRVGLRAGPAIGPKEAPKSDDAALGGAFPAHPGPRPVASNDDAAARIGQRLAEARQAQLGLLLASLNGPARKADGRDDAPARGPAAVPAPVTDDPPAASSGLPAANPPSHPNLAPDNAPGQWYLDAMQRALDRYQQGARTVVPPPGAALSVVR